MIKTSLYYCFLLIVSWSHFATGVHRERCLIVFKDSATEGEMEGVKERIVALEGETAQSMGMGSTNHLIKMVYANIARETERLISSMPGVSYTEEDGTVSQSTLIASIPTDTSRLFGESSQLFSTDRYNLDVLNSEEGQCGNGNYVPLNRGTGVDIYILDGGINYEHIEFRYGVGDQGCRTESRAKYGGYDAVDDLLGEDRRGADCLGHGTHVAGIAGGLRSGVAKNANLWSIRVLNCVGFGSEVGVILGMDYVMSLHVNKSKSPGFVGSVVNMSLGGPRHQTANEAVDRLVAAGVVVVTSSGNEGSDACNISPGSANSSINVAAFKMSENGTRCQFELESFSNFGSCVDIVAPGSKVVSATCFPPNVLTPGQNCSTTSDFFALSGTSMASPHVSGTAALIKRFQPNSSPQEIKSFIQSRGIDDVIRSVNGTSKRLHLF